LFLVDLYFSNTLTIKHLFVDSCIVFPGANIELLFGISLAEHFAVRIKFMHPKFRNWKSLRCENSYGVDYGKSGARISLCLFSISKTISLIAQGIF